MKRLLSALLVVVFAALAMAIPAEAQPRSVMQYDRNSGYYNPYYNDGYNRYGYDRYNRDPRMTDPCYGSDQFYQGVRGTIHAHKGVMHFRPCDPTNRRIGTADGGALGAGGGALLGSLGGRKGAAVGAVGGAIVGGVLGSKHAHDNCVVMGSGNPSQTMQSSAQQVPSKASEEMAPAPQHVESVRNEAVNPENEISWTTVNTTDFPALVIDPNNGKKTLIQRRGSVELPNPSGPKAYEVKILSPGAGKTDVNPGQIKPSKDFLRWEILALE